MELHETRGLTKLTPRWVFGRPIATGATHKCEGILAKYPGQIFWLACTSLYKASPDQKDIAKAALDSGDTRVMLGQDPDKPFDPNLRPPRTAIDMTRDRIDITVVDNWNQRILKDLPEGASKDFYQLGDLVIVDLADAGVQPLLRGIDIRGVGRRQGPGTNKSNGPSVMRGVGRGRGVPLL
jgi:hypothetical protein